MALSRDEESRRLTKEPSETPLAEDSVVHRLAAVRERLARAEHPLDGSRVVDLSLVETETEIEPVRSEPAGSAPIAEAPAPPEPILTVRPSRWQSFRMWWRQDSVARADEKRARAAAEAAARARAMQGIAPPSADAERSDQVVRGLLELNDERFQSLGIRSDRLHDELVGISSVLTDLRGLVESGESPRRVVGPATEAIGDLQERFDALLGALSEEFDRRSLETERRLSEQLVMQSAELATLLESAVVRIRTAIPEELDKLRTVIPEEMDKLRTVIPEEMDKLRAEIPEAVERAAAAMPAPIVMTPPVTVTPAEETKAEWAKAEGAKAEGAKVDVPGFDEQAFERKLTELLVAMNRNTDRLADTMHRGMFELEQEIIRRRPRPDDA